VSPTGGNAVFERGVTHPDEVLADLAAILHPDRLPGHDFVYFRQAAG
jgi:iron complex transport system substrate-binding protein